MLLTDRLYGTQEIDTHVLIDLIDSPSIQRPKSIAWFGVLDDYYSLKSDII